jgi:hypothetical protein
MSHSTISNFITHHKNLLWIGVIFCVYMYPMCVMYTNASHDTHSVYVGLYGLWWVAPIKHKTLNSSFFLKKTIGETQYLYPTYMNYTLILQKNPFSLMQFIQNIKSRLPMLKIPWSPLTWGQKRSKNIFK